MEAVATAIDADAGEALPGLRQTLIEAKAGMAGRRCTVNSSQSFLKPPVVY